MMYSLLKKSLLALAVLGSSSFFAAQAAPVTLSSSFNTSTDYGVQVKYTGHMGSWQNTSAGAFNLTPISPPGSTFDGFCVSLNVSVGNGPDIIQANVVSPLSSVTNPPYFTDSAFADAGNRLAFILVKHASDANPLADAAAALAVWHTIDQNFQYQGGSAALNTHYASYVSFTGYDANTAYGGDCAKLYVMTEGTDYQNLIGLDPNCVPEPAAIVSAAVGLVGVGLAGLRRNRKPA